MAPRSCVCGIWTVVCVCVCVCVCVVFSYEGNALEDPWAAPSEDMFTRSVSPEQVSGRIPAQRATWWKP